MRLPTDAEASADSGDQALDATDAAAEDGQPGPPTPNSNIAHLVVIVQENHSFDSYFGRYCTGPSGVVSSCTTGRACCEAGPATDPTGASPVVLDDAANAAHDPDHASACESIEIHEGAMDKFTGPPCGHPQNFAYAQDGGPAQRYWQWADQGSLADRYFQPIVGASSANDMYFARARFAFEDNGKKPLSAASECVAGDAVDFAETTIGDLLRARGVP